VRPVSIFDDEFADALRGRSEKAKASEMEHALRYTIKINMDKDPIYYRSLAEKLEKIIKEHQGQWDELVKKLSKFTETIESGGDILPFFAEIGCDVCMPFYRLFRTPLGEDDLEALTQEMLLQLVIDSVQIAAREIQKVDFWGTTGESSRKELENVLVGRIASTKNKALIGAITTLKPDFMQLCEKNHHALKTLKLNH
jgi:type I restriction enzyme R subunit